MDESRDISTTFYGQVLGKVTTLFSSVTMGKFGNQEPFRSWVLCVGLSLGGVQASPRHVSSFPPDPPTFFPTVPYPKGH